MEFFDVVGKRRTIRDFAHEAVCPVKVRRALEAGLRAPTHNHLREWEFILVRERAVRQQLVRVEQLADECDVEALRREFRDLDPLAREMVIDALPKQKRMLLGAPELLAVIYRPHPAPAEGKPACDRNALASVWCCIENILLALAAEELYGVTYIPRNAAAVKAVLGVPAELEVAALVPFGGPAVDARVPRQKGVDLADRLHFNHWGRREVQGGIGAVG